MIDQPGFSPSVLIGWSLAIGVVFTIWAVFIWLMITIITAIKEAWFRLMS